MGRIHRFEQKELELRYGPAIAQYVCDELAKTERLNAKIQERKLYEGFGEKTIFYKAA